MVFLGVMHSVAAAAVRTGVLGPSVGMHIGRQVRSGRFSGRQHGLHGPFAARLLRVPFAEVLFPVISFLFRGHFGTFARIISSCMCSFGLAPPAPRRSVTLW